MKVLLITKNYHGWLASGELDYQLEIARQADVTFLGVGYPNYTPNMDVRQFCRDHGGFDVIYYSQCTTENPGDFKHMAETPCPKIGYLHNGHNYFPQQVARITHWGTSLILYRAWESHYYDYAGQLRCPVKFHPQAINPDVFHDYGLEKDYDVNFTGIIVPHYQLRCQQQQRLKVLANNGLKVAFAFHPGYGNDWRSEYDGLKKHGAVWREDYAQLMNQCKITLTCGGRYRIAVRRYFEACATKSLLLAPSPCMHQLYGFDPGKNFVPVYGGTWEMEMNRHLDRYEQSYREIVEPAYEWVMKHHTTPIRVKQLLDIFETVLERFS